MNKKDFIHYMAQRYGIDTNQAECMTDMFADCLQDALDAGCSVSIDQIGKFYSAPLFPSGVNCKKNKELAKLATRKMICLKPNNRSVA